MSSLSPTDLELVRGLHARDPKALARVYGDYHAAVYNLCARILGDREEAKDVTQDVFLKAFGKPPAAIADVRLRPWLYRVATNACLNLIRGRRDGGPVEEETLAAGVDRYEQARTAALIESTLAGMNERYRAALVLKDLHGLDGRELAEVLQVSRPTADVLVHRARAAFRHVFAGLAGDDAVVPANLAVALPALAVPAALQALPLPAASHAPLPVGAPPGPAPGATAGLGPLAAASGAGTAAASGAGPAAGLLTKIGAAVGTKAAVVAAGAAVVAGGGVAAVKLAGNEQAARPVVTGGSPGVVDEHATGGHRRRPFGERRLAPSSSARRGPHRRSSRLRPAGTAPRSTSPAMVRAAQGRTPPADRVTTPEPRATPPPTAPRPSRPRPARRRPGTTAARAPATTRAASTDTAAGTDGGAPDHCAAAALTPDTPCPHGRRRPEALRDRDGGRTRPCGTRSQWNMTPAELDPCAARRVGSRSVGE